MNKEQYSSWLAGFIDAEGNFQVYLDRLYLRVMFRIRLHKDDIDVLQKNTSVFRCRKSSYRG